MAILDSRGQPISFAHAADRSTRRGPQFATRNDDIERLIPANDRKTLASLSNRLFVNMGVPRACVLTKADYSVGEAWLPSYLGPEMGDKSVDQAIGFMRDVWLHQCDTRGGIFDWWKLLELTSIGMDRDGDVFWILVKGEDNFPRIQMVAGHRCYSRFEKRVEQGEWKGYRIIDGIIYYADGSPAAYRFNVGNDGVEKIIEVPAASVIHNFDPTHCEQGRGLPAFTHALESLKMSLLSTEDERVRQQIISRLHLTVFNDMGGPSDEASGLLGGDDGCEPVDGFASQDFPGGVMYLPAEGGHKIEQIKHENPGVVWSDFQDRIVRDAVISVWSYNIWKGAGQGTDSRGEVVKCRRFVTKRQGQLWYAAKRAMSWAYSVFASQGRVPHLKNPTKWGFSYPPRLSVDDGRESKMESEEVRLGSRNVCEVLEARGLTEDKFLETRAWSVAKRKATAARVAEEASAKYGVPITIEEREMFMLTPNEVSEQSSETSTSDSGEGENKQSDNTEIEFANLKSKFDAYGVAVRAGAITPAMEDENLFREEGGLPPMPNSVKGAWAEDKGFRRPITLVSGSSAPPTAPNTTEDNE